MSAATTCCASGPTTRRPTSILLYLESFGDPVRFARVARAVSQRKPVVALKSGASAAGQRGARSHTAAIASDQSMVDALFTHTGVVRARTLEELIDVGVLLDRQPAPRGRRVALIGNAGGPLVLGADAADAAGLDVPLLSSRLQDEIIGRVPSAPSMVNPVDLGPEVTPDELAATVRAIARSGEVDACIVVCVELGERHRLDEVAVLLADAALDDVTRGPVPDRCRPGGTRLVADVPDPRARRRGRGPRCAESPVVGVGCRRRGR